MKLLIVLFACCICLTTSAQNFGINNNNPKAALDLNGGLRTRVHVISATAGPVTLGFGNTAVGYFTLANSNGHENIGIGIESGGSGWGNISIGKRTLNNDTGYNNIAIGHSAGANTLLTSNKLFIENDPATTANNALIYGDFAADSLNLNAKVNIRDFTRLGTRASGAPAIKMKKIIIPAGPAVDGLASYPLGSGITDSKVLGLDVMMKYDNAGTSKIPPSYRDTPGYEYNIQIQFDGVTVINKPGNSSNIGAKQITILVTYEE